MRLPSASPARIKNLLHAFQGVLIFFTWALSIAVFTKGGGIDGRSGWLFGLCWLSIPFLIYLVAVPTFPRARRFGNVYAFATLDVLMVILWFSGWVAVASYVAEGKRKGENDNKDNENEDEKKSGCDAFAYGPPSKCRISTATVIFGVVIFLAFIATSFFSIRNVVHFRRTGTMPDSVADPTFDAQTKAAFASTPVHDFDEEDEFRSGRVNEGPSSSAGYGRDRDEDYTLLQQHEAEDHHHGGGGVQPYDPTAGAPSGSALHDYNTSYPGPYGSRYSDTDTSYQPYGR
ncbi:hypothetical protein VTN31DRAFT_4708 [Thermomyces dupontii]|uniref:uncharacterized protein n=1 Tax=Talaromyces thermophilus TaxID=28565 RepID=UPI0037443A1A